MIGLYLLVYFVLAFIGGMAYWIILGDNSGLSSGQEATAAMVVGLFWPLELLFAFGYGFVTLWTHRDKLLWRSQSS